MKRAHAGEMMPLVRAGFAGVVAASLAAAAAGQTQYDQVPRERTVTTQEVVEADMQNARLVVGPMRLVPTILVEDAGYDNNVFNAPSNQPQDIVSDWTATVGAGGRMILPLGSKFYLRAVAVPQYIWYNKLADRRTWAGDFNGSFLALGNRLQFEADGGLNRGLTVLSSETQATVVETDSSAAGKLEVGLTRALSLVANATLDVARYAPESQVGSPDPIDVTVYDRTDTSALAGLRLRVNSWLDVTGGAQGTRAEFVQDPLLRDNQTFAYLGGIHIDRPNFYVNLAGGYRKARGLNGSVFPHYNTTIGSYYVSWKAIGPLELEAYGHRRPFYSRFAADLFYIETRYGGGFRLQVGPRVEIHAGADVGTNFYPIQFLPNGEHRSDDAQNYGGGLSVQVFRAVSIHATARQSILKPSIERPERKIFRITTGLSFNAEYTRE
jgi:hypothetical protein